MLGTTADGVRRDLDAAKRAVVKAGDELARLRAEVERLNSAAMTAVDLIRSGATFRAECVLLDALARGDGAS